MGLLDWWRRRKQEREREAASMAEMRRADEPAVPDTPSESYMSQTRD